MWNKRIFLELTIVLIYATFFTSAQGTSMGEIFSGNTKTFQNVQNTTNCITNCTEKQKQKFEKFKKRYAKIYMNQSSECEALENFCKTYDIISRHNANASALFKMRVSPDADKSDEVKDDLLAKRTGLKLDSDILKKRNELNIDTLNLTSSILRKYNPRLSIESKILTNRASETNFARFTGPVKDQGICGSCWTFCATAVLQFQQLVFQNISTIMSEQFIMDCNNRRLSCNGGNPVVANELAHTQGMLFQSQYPYKMADSPTCRRNSSMEIAYKSPNPSCSSFANEAQLLSIVQNFGVVAIGIGVGQSFSMYQSGIYDDRSCPLSITHCVTVVGFGTDDRGIDYWIIQNTWGRQWGEGGFMRMRRNANICGINQCFVAFPCR